MASNSAWKSFMEKNPECSYFVVVVAQLVKWSLPTPKVHSSNPVIGK